MPGLSGELRQKLTQSQTLAPQMRQGLELLAMSLPELRQRLYDEMSRNPCIEDIEATLEKTTVSEEVREMERDESVDDSDSPDEDYEPEFGAAVLPQCAEAELLCYIDMIDSRMEIYREVLDKTEPGQFSDRVFALDNKRLYRHK